MLGSRPLAVYTTPLKTKQPNKQHRHVSGCSGPVPLAICASEVFGPSPLAVLWYGIEGEGAPRPSYRTHAIRRKEATRSPSCVGSSCRGLFLATLGKGPEPNARRSGLVRWDTCAAVSGRRAAGSRIPDLGSICIFHKRGVTRRRDVMRLPECKGNLSQKGLGAASAMRHRRRWRSARSVVAGSLGSGCSCQGRPEPGAGFGQQAAAVRFEDALVGLGRPCSCDTLQGPAGHMLPGTYTSAQSQPKGWRAIQSSSMPPDRYRD